MLAYCDDQHTVRVMCWILREDTEGKFVALTLIDPNTTSERPAMRLVTVQDPRRFDLNFRKGFTGHLPAIARHSISACVRVLAPFLR